MTKALDQAIDAAKSLPDAKQDRLADLVLIALKVEVDETQESTPEFARRMRKKSADLGLTRGEIEKTIGGTLPE